MGPPEGAGRFLSRGQIRDQLDEIDSYYAGTGDGDAVAARIDGHCHREGWKPEEPEDRRWDCRARPSWRETWEHLFLSG